MKKLILLDGIGLVVGVILVVWALIAGLGLVPEKLPHWMSDAEKRAGAASGKAKEALPRIQEKAGEVSPEITDEMSSGKRTIGYKGKVEIGTGADFYNQETSALSFKKKVLSASTHEEDHEYKKAKKALEFGREFREDGRQEQYQG
jgi:hypothetical protein